MQTAILQHATSVTRSKKAHPRALHSALGLLGLTHGEPQRMNGQGSIRLAFVHAHGTTAARVRLCKVKVKPSPASQTVTSTPISHRFNACRQHIHIANPKAASVRGGKHGQANELDIIVEYEPSIAQQGTPSCSASSCGEVGMDEGKSLPDQPSRQRGAKMKISGAISFSS